MVAGVLDRWELGGVLGVKSGSGVFFQRYVVHTDDEFLREKVRDTGLSGTGGLRISEGKGPRAEVCVFDGSALRENYYLVRVPGCLRYYTV